MLLHDVSIEQHLLKTAISKHKHASESLGGPLHGISDLSGVEPDKSPTKILGDGNAAASLGTKL